MKTKSQSNDADYLPYVEGDEWYFVVLLSITSKCFLLKHDEFYVSVEKTNSSFDQKDDHSQNDYSPAKHRHLLQPRSSC